MRIEQPRPESATSCGLPGALSVNRSDAVREPAALGLKALLTLQLAPGASVCPPQPLAVITKSPGLAPASATALIDSAAVPLLVTVTCFAALVVPTVRLPKLRLAGFGENAGAPGCPPS